MMFRRVVEAALLIGAVSGSIAISAEREGAEVGSVKTDAEADAVQRAREMLARQLGTAPEAVTVDHVEPRSWSDSSMGCGKRGAVALTVITEGYAVSLSANGRKHQVHVSANNAVVCDKTLALRRDARTVNAKGLDVMLQEARRDLAQKLGVEASAVGVADMQPRQWTNSGLECPRENETVQEGPIAGYRLSLRHAGRIYTYHTDLKSVRACPAIELE